MSKKILAAGANGKYFESSAGSIDETSGEVTINKLNISSSMYVSGTSGLLNQSLGVVENLNLDGAVSGSVLWSTGGKFQLSEISLETLGGDLEGLLSNARVASVENVVSGTLSLAAGGTGKTSLASGSLFALSQSNIPASAQSIVTVNNSGTQWITSGSSIIDITPLSEPVAYLYTGSVGVNQTFTWTKPSGARFVRIICQGGGAGGQGGQKLARTSTTTIASGGGGGGGGGYSEITLNGLYLPSQITIVAGAAGSGGQSASSSDQQFIGTNGGSSSFGNIIYSTGGSSDGTNGIGYKYNGQSANISYISGVKGGNGGSSRIQGGGSGNNSGLNGFSVIDASGGIGGLAGVSWNTSAGDAQNPIDMYNLFFQTLYVNNVLVNNIPKLVCGGGGGGGGASMYNTTPSANAGNGSSATFGSGGGGGGALRQGPDGGVGLSGKGGNGGVGYVLIICY